MRKKKLRLLAVLLAACMLCSCSAPVYPRSTDEPQLQFYYCTGEGAEQSEEREINSGPQAVTCGPVRHSPSGMTPSWTSAMEAKPYRSPARTVYQPSKSPSTVTAVPFGTCARISASVCG